MMKQTYAAGHQVRGAYLTLEERLHTFNQIIMHPHLITAALALKEAIREPGDDLIIFLCGPAGVGKTSLKKLVLQAHREKERTPVLSLIARPPLYGSFSWREFLQNGISLLEQFLIDKKNIIENEEEKTQVALKDEMRPGGGRPVPRIRDDDLRISFETVMEQYRPSAVIVDDAQHLGRVSGKRQLQNQLDCLKSIAENTGIPHMLIGTYELLSILEASPQATGYSYFIHFPRYESTYEELSQFKSVLSAFQDMLPFEEATNILLEHWEFCYERSLGCIGLLHMMLTRAVRAALWADETTLSKRYLERYAISSLESYTLLSKTYDIEFEPAYTPSGVDTRQTRDMKPQSRFHQAKSRAGLRTKFRWKDRRTILDQDE